MVGEDAWSGYTHDPRVPAHAGLRASDHDRAVTAQVLAEAYAEGRLDVEEHATRLASCEATRTLGELVPLITDVLPPSGPGAVLSRSTSGELRRRAEDDYASDRRSAVLGFLGPTLVTWTVYAAIEWGESPADWHFPWPLIVMAVSLMNLLRVLLTRTDIVEAKVAELEKKQARAQAKQAKAERKQRESELSWSDRERLDPVAVRTAAEIARQRAREAALAIEQDVVRRVNARFGPDGAGGSRPPDPPQDGSSR